MADGSSRQPLLADRRAGYDQIGEDEEDVEVLLRQTKKNKARRCMQTVIVFLLGSLLLAAVIILVILLLKVGGQPPQVSVTCGKVQGTYDSILRVYSFKAIPYAAKPVGSRRWQPPEALSHETCWTGLRHAENYRNQCAQRDPFTSKFIGSEDCLYVDVFSPSLEPRHLPVMVYFHGGYLRFGNASMPGYYPDKELAANLNVVFVNVQYRLGTMGFLVLDELNGTGNYAFLDQIQALKWVQENIANFGGNPSNVTIFGQSSGGSSVLNLVISPLAAGLFHRAWSSSGSPVFDATLQQARQNNAFFVARVGCDKAADVGKCLLNVSAENATMKTYPEWNYNNALDLPEKGVLEYPLPVVDGHVFKAGLLESFQQNLSVINRVPLLIGTTAQEADVMPDFVNDSYSDFAKWNEETYRTYVSSHLDTFSSNITEEALSLYPYDQAELTYTSMVSDVRATCPNDQIALAAAEAMPGMVYRYVVTSRPSSPVYALGLNFPAKYSFHLWDIFAFFNSIHMYMTNTPRQSDYNFLATFQNMIVSFVNSGQPEVKDWRAYNTAAHPVGLIGEKVEVDWAYNEEKCTFWLSNDFFKYGWMN